MFSIVFSPTVTLVLLAVVSVVAIVSVVTGLYSDTNLRFPPK